MSAVTAAPVSFTAFKQVQDYLAKATSSPDSSAAIWSPQENFCTALANILARAAGTGEVVGFLSLSSQPTFLDSLTTTADEAAAAEAATWLQQSADKLGYNSSSTGAFVTCCVVTPGWEIAVAEALLRAAFQACPLLQTLLVGGSSGALSAAGQGVLRQLLPAVAQNSAATAGDDGLELLQASRSQLLGRLQVRRARVEDHDDLVAVLGAAGDRYPSLAALPDAAAGEEAYALTGLIGQQDGRNVVLVAEERGRVVGFLAATGDIDVPLLQQSFDLGPYDAFLPPDAYTALEQQAREGANAVAAARAAATVMAEGSGGDSAGAQAVPSEAEVARELAGLVMERLVAAPEGHTLVVVTMLCMLPEWEEAAVEFVEPLFEALPDKLYMGLSLPRTSSEPPLCRLMTPLLPPPGAAFPEVLRVLQPAALLPDWVVRAGGGGDVAGVTALVAGLVGGEDLVEAFVEAAAAGAAVVGLVEGEVVAVATTTLTVNVPLLTASFDLEELLLGGVPPLEQHLELNACIINPIFSARGAAFLEGMLRVLRRSVLHYALPPAAPAPEVLGVMAPVRPRRRAAAGGADFSLHTFTPCMTACPRRRVNAQVVFAGASETSLSCLEALLFDRSAALSNLLLLAPGGVGVGGVACAFPASVVTQLGLGARVTLVDGRMVALDKEQRLVLLDDGNSIDYDMLVLATGMQDQLGSTMATSCPEAAHFVVPGGQLIGELGEEDAAALRSVLVVGLGLEAFTLLAALTAKGVAPEAITWVAPEAVAADQTVVLCRALAAEAELPVPEHQVGALHSMRLTEEGDQAVCVLQASDGVLQELEVDLVLGAAPPQPSADTAAACAAAGLVWDGRLVVDGGFRTCDGGVMAAGPMARFSKRYGGQGLSQACYNSSELGRHLAASLLQAVDPAAAAAGVSSPSRAAAGAQEGSGGDGSTAPVQLPPLAEGKLVGASLPGGWTFALATAPSFLQQQEAERAARLEADKAQRAALAALGAGRHDAAEPTGGLQLAWVPEGGGALLSRGGGGVLLLALDGRCTIVQVGYLGPQPANVAQLGGLVGLHISYLAAGCGLPSSWEGGAAGYIAAVAGASSSSDGVRCLELAAAGVVLLEQDLLVALAEPWAEPLFHDKFKQLRRQLLAEHVAASQALAAAAANKEQGQGGEEEDDSAQERDVEGVVKGAALQWVLRCGEELPGMQQRLLEALRSQAAC